MAGAAVVGARRRRRRPRARPERRRRHLRAHGAVAARDAVLVIADDADPLRLAVPRATRRWRRSCGATGQPTSSRRSPTSRRCPAGDLDAVGSVLPYRDHVPGRRSATGGCRAGAASRPSRGSPFYRRGDGGDATSLLPAHAFGALDVRDALQAPWYGDRAGGGVVDARLFDREDALRVTNGDGAFAVGRDPVVLAATSWDGDGMRRLVAARANGALGPVSATVVALLGDAPGAHYAGAGAELHAATRTFDVGARFGLTTDVADAASRNDGSVADAAFDVSGRGPNAIAVRARWRDERGTLGERRRRAPRRRARVRHDARQRRAHDRRGRVRARRRPRVRRGRARRVRGVAVARARRAAGAELVAASRRRRVDARHAGLRDRARVAGRGVDRVRGPAPPARGARRVHRRRQRADGGEPRVRGGAGLGDRAAAVAARVVAARRRPRRRSGDRGAVSRRTRRTTVSPIERFDRDVRLADVGRADAVGRAAAQRRARGERARPARARATR